MTLASTMQDDWGGGMHRGKRSPANAVYDAINAIVLDDGTLAKRGGSSYLSTSNAGSTLIGVADVTLAAGQRTLMWASGALWVLDGSSAPVSIGGGGDSPLASARAKGVGQYVAFPPQSPTGFGAVLYAGTRKTTPYGTGTVTVTNASATLTGVGTSWVANVDAGMILKVTGSSYRAVVKSVDTNTSITLVSPWEGTTAAGASYGLFVYDLVTSPDGIIPSVVGSAGRRLLIADGNRVAFSARGQPALFTAGEYHELPAGANIVGIDAIQDTAILFTTAGIWQVANMALDAVDDFGNQQQIVSRIGDLVLLDDPGVAGWQGGFVVPALDDIHLFAPGTSQPITAGADGRGGFQEKTRRLWQSYVKAGYRPGTATVHRGHYLLPVLNAGTLVDVLVCRLDRGAVWTRWSGHSAGTAYATRAASSSGAPKLLGIAAQRVTDLTGCFDPTSSNAVEADATTPDCTITTRDYPTQQAHGFVQRARLRYELTDDGSGGTAAPTVALAYSSDADAGAFTTLTDKGLQAGGTGGAVSSGDKYSWWTVGKRRERLRFRITQSGACASFVLRSLEMLTRASGRQ